MTLVDRHYKGIALLWAGYSRPEIAEVLGLSPHTINEWHEHPEFKEALHGFQDILHTKVKQDISGLVVVALDTLRGLLRNGDEVTKRRCVEIVFKIAGLGNETILLKERELLPRVPDEDPIERIERLAGKLRAFLKEQEEPLKLVAQTKEPTNG